MYGGSRVLRISSISQYTGDEAAAWFSTLLDTPGCKMYQICEPRKSTEDTKWGDIALPGDQVLYPTKLYSQIVFLSVITINYIF